MSRNNYTAAEFMSDLETAISENRVSKLGRRVLLRDMSDIVDKINETHRSGQVDIAFPSSFEYKSSILSSGYIRKYYNTGVIASEEWNDAEGLSRQNDKPALIEYYEDGNIRNEEWFMHGFQHSDNGAPAAVFYHNNGTIIREEYWHNGYQRRYADEG